ncbi:MAG TPA: LysR substrate-binding domain-containing protein, partial [Janthinobacterium sp.]|nr:LysR substrate-binding domain-containing protein [Janthinobacterium sp.]
NDGDVVLGWALDGHGILLRSEWDLARYLDSGRLQTVLADYTLPPADLYVYYPSRMHLPAKVRAFIDFLIAGFNPREDLEKPAAQSRKQQNALSSPLQAHPPAK